ncbi:MAG TPA: UDP-N-acetylmuramoyl-L-alanine--D-glutamate ligase, partial [Candidatus Cloacimonadota bacterium]|nr:UDP-N-acetylmuramoyl-L-alanine--D-glutamate ligase [Candidatus Cloacimonadota bacterium]
SVLNDYIKKHVKKLFLVGASKEEMAEVFAGIVDLQVFDTFEEVVSASFLQAKPGDTVVLSPACTSYDLFNNFEERGDYFKKLVKELKK